MPKSKRTTLKDISEQVGYTVNTVSLALQDSPLVIPETKEKIRKIAREMGYVHNVLAGSLRSGRSHTIAVLFGDLSNLLFAQRVSSLGKALEKRGYRMLILNTDEDEAVEFHSIKTALSHSVDGVILCPCQHSQKSLELLQAYHIPCVLLGRSFENADFDSITWDDWQGGVLATQHLIENGCRKIIFLDGPALISSALQRKQGYESAMRAAGLVPMTIHSAATAGSVVETLNALEAARVTYDGLFVFSDLMAMEAASWLLKRGIAIPEDVKLIGFDDILSSISLPFELSSIASDREAEAEMAAQFLVQRISQPDAAVQTLRLPVKLMQRRSSTQ